MGWKCGGGDHEFTEGYSTCKGCLAELARLREEVGRLERKRDGDMAARELWRSTALDWQRKHDEARAELERLERAMMKVEQTAIRRGECGVPDAIDNDGQPYQSEWMAKIIAGIALEQRAAADQFAAHAGEPTADAPGAMEEG